jgi:resuscitation-promoting factor RpfB
MIQSVHMLPKIALRATAGLVTAAVLLLTVYLLRPITLNDNGTPRPIHSAFTTGQALYAAGVSLDPADQVEPGLNQPIPINGQIRIRRVVQVTLWENELTRLVTGFETSPFALLQRNNILLGPGDRLLWDGQPVDNDTRLPSGKPVVLQVVRARPVTLNKGSQRQSITSSAPTAARLLWDAGVRLAPGDLLSVPPGDPPQANATIAYLPGRPLTIQVSGQTIRARTSAETVGQALADAGVALQGLDYAQPSEDQPLPADGKIRVVRVHEEISLKEAFIPFESKTQTDPNVELDTRRVTRAGQYGVKVERERARFEDGQEISRAFDSDWIASQPVAQVVGVGSKVVAKSADTPDGKIEYYRAIRVYATSFSPCNQMMDHCSTGTASGMRLEKGVIGVSLAWYRMLAGQRVYVTGYGFGVIGDTGGGMRDVPWIDMGFDEDSFKTSAFVGWVTMYFLMPAPANVPLNFP